MTPAYIERVKDALGFKDGRDAALNLEGVLYDLKLSGVFDKVCERTLRRVIDQIERVRAISIAMAKTQPQWRPIESAPIWVSQNEALIGQLNSGGRWVKVSLWNEAWHRDTQIERGATHWMPLPALPEGIDA